MKFLVIALLIYSSICIGYAHETGHERYFHTDSADTPNPFTKEESKYIKDKKSIVICTDPDWMPFEKFDNNGEYIGVSADYHKIISHITGLDYKYLMTDSWPETLANAKAGKCDILSILNKTVERDEYLDFTKPYITSPSIFVTREHDKFINGIDDLQEGNLAVVEGYMVDEVIKNKYPNIKRIYVKTIVEALKMVSRGEAFATTGSLLEMSYNIRQQGMLNLKITGDAKLDYELRIGVKKGDRTLLSIMDKALDMISKPDRDAILNKWISIKYQKSYDYDLIWKVIIGFSVLIALVALRYITTSKYNKKLVALNKDLKDAKEALEKMNKTLEMKVKGETAKNLQNERLLMQQSKLAAMGDMIGAIAHQWRQPLNSVGMLIQDIEDAQETGTLTEEHIKYTVSKAMQMVLQMSDTIDDFSNFFKPDKDFVCFRVCSAISDVASMFEPQLVNHNIKLNITCTENSSTYESGASNPSFTCCGSYSVRGFPNEFKHVILNLLKNSMDALDCKKAEDKYINVAIKTTDMDYCYIEISDNGGGIPDKIKSRIFEPYFTTKSQEQGVGIGLYMSKQIVGNMNGEMWFENSNEGAVFTIKLKTCDITSERTPDN